MNPRKTFLQMTNEERRTFLESLTREINHQENDQPTYNPVKKAVLEKVIEFANASMASWGQKPSRYEACDKMFQARHLSTLCFLEAVTEEISTIEEENNKLKGEIYTEASKRLAVLKEAHKSILSGFSIGLIASSAVLFWYDWPASMLLALNGVLLNKFSDGIVDIRVSQALKEQRAELLLKNPAQVESLQGDFGDSIEKTQHFAKEKMLSGAYAVAGFFNRQWNRCTQRLQPVAVQADAPVNPAPVMNQ